MISTHAFLNIGSTTLTDVLLFQIRDKTGKIDLSFQDQAEIKFDGSIEAGQAYEFRVYESANKTSWTLISGASAIALKQGGQQRITVQTQKQYLKVSARVTTAGGGLVRLDMSLNGKLYFGQGDLDIIGKSGYGKDFGSGEGAASGTVPAWPE